MTISNLLLTVATPLIAYIVTAGVKAIAARWKIDVSGVAPNVIAAATALLVMYAPQIAAAVPSEYQPAIITVGTLLFGATGGAGIHATVSKFTPTGSG